MNLDEYYENLISIQRKAIRAWWAWVIGVVLLGVIIVIISPFFTGTSSDILKIGGAFMGVLAAYPYKEIPPRRERIASYTQLKNYFAGINIPEEEKHKLFMDLTLDAFKETMRRGPNA